jgi:hypothetical protein
MAKKKAVNPKKNKSKKEAVDSHLPHVVGKTTEGWWIVRDPQKAEGYQYSHVQPPVGTH